MDCSIITWWRHQMETFSALLAICAGNSPVTGGSPTQKPVTRSFDGFFDLRLNKRLSKQTWVWLYETPSRSLWCHCNDSNRTNTFLATVILFDYNKPVAQIPQCTCPISHNVPFCSKNVHIYVSKCCIVGLFIVCGIVGFVRLVYWMSLTWNYTALQNFGITWEHSRHARVSVPSLGYLLPMLTHWGRDKMDAISQTTCSIAFPWMKIFEFRLKFHWSLFLRVQLTINIVSDNGLAPPRRQAIIWTNEG